MKAVRWVLLVVVATACHARVDAFPWSEWGVDVYHYYSGDTEVQDAGLDGTSLVQWASLAPSVESYAVLENGLSNSNYLAWWQGSDRVIEDLDLNTYAPVDPNLAPTIVRIRFYWKDWEHYGNPNPFSPLACSWTATAKPSWYVGMDPVEDSYYTQSSAFVDVRYRGELWDAETDEYFGGLEYRIRRGCSGYLDDYNEPHISPTADSSWISYYDMWGSGQTVRGLPWNTSWESYYSQITAWPTVFSEYWIGWDFMYPSATDYQYGEIAPALSMRWYGGTYATQPTYDLYFIVETDGLLRVDTIPYEGDGVAAVANFGMGFDFIVD